MGLRNTWIQTNDWYPKSPLWTLTRGHGRSSHHMKSTSVYYRGRCVSTVRRRKGGREGEGEEGLTVRESVMAWWYLGYCRGSLVTFMHTRDGRKGRWWWWSWRSPGRTHSATTHTMPYYTLLYGFLLMSKTQAMEEGKGHGWNGKESKGKGKEMQPTPPPQAADTVPWACMYIYICHRYPVPTRSRVFTNGLPTLDV